MNKFLRIGIAPTERCDRGCPICLCDSKKKGEEIELAKLLKFAEEISKSSIRIEAFITGWGEPLLYPNLPEVVEVFSKVTKDYFLYVTTSGCKNEKDTGYDVLEELIKGKAQFSPLLSFPEYTKEVEERLLFSLPLLQEVIGYTIIRAVTSLDPNFISYLYKIIQKMGYFYLKQAKKEHFLPLTSLASDYKWAYNIERQEKTLIKRDYGNDKKILFAEVQISPLAPVGRAKKIYHSRDEKNSCLDLMGYNEKLIISPSGRVYPCCVIKDNDKIAIGEIGKNSLQELVERRSLKIDELRKKFLSSKEMGISDPCELCLK